MKELYSQALFVVIQELLRALLPHEKMGMFQLPAIICNEQDGQLSRRFGALGDLLIFLLDALDALHNVFPRTFRHFLLSGSRDLGDAVGLGHLAAAGRSLYFWSGLDGFGLALCSFLGLRGGSL